MRKLNLRWILGLVIGSFCLGVLTFLLHEFQMARNASAYVREAKRLQAEKRPEDAVIHLRRYVKLAPQDAEGWVLYGTQLADLGHIEPAYLVLERVIRQWPNRSDVRRRLVGLAIDLGRYSDATDHLQNHLLKKSPQDGELHEQLSDCQFAREEYQEAQTSLETAIANAPDRLEAPMKLASLLRDKLNRTSDAIDPIDRMVARNSSNPLAYFYRSQWYMERLNELKASLKVGRATGQQDAESLLKQADADARQALRLAPNDANTIMLAVQIAYESERTDEARELAKHGIEIHPSDSRFYVILAQLEKTSKNSKAALEVLRRGAVDAPKDLDLKWQLADLLVELGHNDEAATAIEQLSAGRYPEAFVNYLEAKSLIYRNEWLAAIRKLDAARPGLRERPDLVGQIDVWLGLAYGETKSRDQQLISFRRAVAFNPDWIPARLALAESLMNANLLQEAVTEFQQILSKPAAPVSAAIGLAKSLLLLNLRTPPNQQNWTEFDDVLKRIEQLDLPITEVVILRMEKLLAKGEREEAANAISAVREKNPTQIDLWSAQIGLAQMSHEWARVEQLLQLAEDQFGDTVAVRLLKGRYLVQHPGGEESVPLQKGPDGTWNVPTASGDTPEAVVSLRGLSEPVASWTEQERLQLAGGFASLFLSIGDFDAAEKLSSVVSQAEPRNVPIRLMQLDVAVRAKRPELMERVLEEFRVVAGEGTIWHYGKAVLVVILEQTSRDKQSYAEALSHLEKARITGPSWERIPLLSAEIHERCRDFPVATEQYLEAIRLGERDPAVTGHALALLFNSKRFDDAKKLILLLRETQSLFSDDLARAEVDVSLQLGRNDEALQYTEQLVRNSQQAQDPMWLGQVYMALTKYVKAEEQFHLATAANGKDPMPWIALVQVLALTRQAEKAENVIAEAKSAIDKDQVLFTVGQCYEILGKPELARVTYQTARDQSPEDVTIGRVWVDFLLKTGAASDAETVLRKMVKATTGTDVESRNNRLWAQRKLAIVLMVGGSSEQLAEALSIVDRNLAAGTQKAAEDLRLKAIILANGSSAEEHQQATSILEKLLNQGTEASSANDDRFVLARLYLLAGDQRKARLELEKLIYASKGDPRYLSAYAQLCLQAGEINDAELHLNALQKLVPNELSTVDLEVQVLYARGMYSKIVTLLKGIGAVKLREPGKPESAAASKLWAAKRLEEFARLLNHAGKTDEAAPFTAESEALYTQFVEERPEERLILAEFLAQTVDVDRSLNLLQDHGPGSTAWRVASVALAMMKNAKATKTQMARLQELLTANVQSHGKSIPLELVSADLMSWRGDYRRAFAVYKDVLSREERNIAALNNLAVLISLTGGDYSEALRLLQQAIEYGGPMDALLDSRGLIHLAAGHPEKALLDFQQAVSKNETAERRFHVASAFAQLKQFKLAQESLDRADALQLSENDLHPLERTKLKKLRTQLNANTPAK